MPQKHATSGQGVGVKNSLTYQIRAPERINPQFSQITHEVIAFI
eukprot:COSAG02_NODE_59994_length_272_cov_1.127168_1_plen_43_part_10